MSGKTRAKGQTKIVAVPKRRRRDKSQQPRLERIADDLLGKSPFPNIACQPSPERGEPTDETNSEYMRNSSNDKESAPPQIQACADTVLS